MLRRRHSPAQITQFDRRRRLHVRTPFCFLALRALSHTLA